MRLLNLNIKSHLEPAVPSVSVLNNCSFFKLPNTVQSAEQNTPHTSEHPKKSQVSFHRHFVIFTFNSLSVSLRKSLIQISVPDIAFLKNVLNVFEKFGNNEKKRRKAFIFFARRVIHWRAKSWASSEEKPSCLNVLYKAKMGTIFTNCRLC